MMTIYESFTQIGVHDIWGIALVSFEGRVEIVIDDELEGNESCLSKKGKCKCVCSALVEYLPASRKCVIVPVCSGVVVSPWFPKVWYHGFCSFWCVAFIWQLSMTGGNSWGC